MKAPYNGTWLDCQVWSNGQSGVAYAMTQPQSGIETHTIKVRPGETQSLLLNIEFVPDITPTDPPMTITLPARGAEGIDVSRHNGNFDWKAAREAGVQFAYIRATMGAPSANYSGIDDRWRYNRAACRWGAGIPDGVYHYMVHDIPAKAQVDNLTEQIRADFGALPIVIDVERRRISGLIESVNREAFTANLFELLHELESIYRHRPLIYTSKIEWEAMTTLPAWEHDYSFVVAQYSPTLTAYRPLWPIAAWQYSTDGGVDHDRWLGPAIPAPGARHNFAPRMNQAVINLFAKAAGKAAYIEWIARAGLNAILSVNTRQNFYVGPDIEELPLTAAEQAALIGAL